MSAPDVREAARLLLCAIDNDERYHGLEAERMALWNALRAALASPDAPSGCIAAPVSPPAAAKRERRTVWFMENSAGLWMRADFCENTQDPNEARWFSTRESCEAACDTVRRNGPHPGVRVYRPTEHIFFGDDEVPVSPPAPRGEAVEPVAWGVLNAYGKVVSTDADESDNNRMMERLREYGAEPPYHVVALVPQESRSDDNEGRQAREEPAP